MERKKRFRAIIISLVVLAVSTWNFSNLTGIENLRAIHIVTLLTCGAAIGIMLVNLVMLLRGKE